ncbi:hypothetical protein JOD54_004102 [Actinokineospora baliensis]|uniref:hypothetical protein n=1 Tax=Actinokineospora baliensis TaxID=547056 RepID=UPI00195CCDE8|nr:hypothetical protein [Actinokineospora baliensis]MBM7773898.1 hypothetical protein [Actinokineospora baliensis]
MKSVCAVVAVLGAMTFVGTGYAEADEGHRDGVLARARAWVDQGVPYGLNDFTDGYRRDSAGFIAMAWSLDDNPTTRRLPDHAVRIDKDQLQPGDVLLWTSPDPRTPGHARLFGGWTDPAHNGYWVYEETAPKARYHEYTWPNTAATYLPYRSTTLPEPTPIPATTTAPTTTTEPPAPPAPSSPESTPPTRPAEPAPPTRPTASTPPARPLDTRNLRCQLLDGADLFCVGERQS